jgi:hypothetical protein
MSAIRPANLLQPKVNNRFALRGEVKAASRAHQPGTLDDTAFYSEFLDARHSDLFSQLLSLISDEQHVEDHDGSLSR